MNPSDYYALIASAYTGNKYNPIVSAPAGSRACP
jgi:hypothetical protein